jgi:hypothetical protein
MLDLGNSCRADPYAPAELDLRDAQSSPRLAHLPPECCRDRQRLAVADHPDRGALGPRHFTLSVILGASRPISWLDPRRHDPAKRESGLGLGLIEAEAPDTALGV